MRKTMMVATTVNRKEALIKLLETIFCDERWDEWYLVLIAQGYEASDMSALYDFVFNKAPRPDQFYIHHLPELVGPHSARLFGLKHHWSDIWVNLDDDVEFLPETQFDRPIEWLMRQSGVGFISTNWARSESFLAKKKLEEVYLKQAVVYTGGGLIYREEIANIMRKIPDSDYLFDDIEWSSRAYMEGYENVRYKGSLCLHRAFTKGGRQAWVGQKNRTLPDTEFFRIYSASEFYKGTDNNYLIPSSRDLKMRAHELHRQNYRGGIRK